MIIKEKEYFHPNIENNHFNKIIILFILIFFIFTVGYISAKYGIIGRLITPIKNTTKISYNYFSSFAVPSKNINLNIKFEDYDKLENFKNEAFEKGALFKNENSFVNAQILHEGKNYQAKLRLKGRGLDHLQGEKWSFRIKIKNDEKLFGMKQFSLQSPKVRNFLYEWFYHEVLGLENIFKLDYIFINLTLNGKNLGTYALEEHFHWQNFLRKINDPGPIIKFNENFSWEEHYQFESFEGSKGSGYGLFSSSPIDSYQTDYYLSDSSKKSLLLNAFQNLDAFRRGELKTSEVFNVDKLAKYFAINDLLGTEHGSRWNNARFYFDSKTALLEPIGFDGNNSIIYNNRTIKYLSATKEGIYVNRPMENINNNYFAILFSDNIFYKRYVQFLEHFSNPNYLDYLFDKLETDIKNNLKLIYKTYPNFDFNKNIFYGNQTYIRAILDPKKALTCFQKELKNDFIILTLGNLQSLPVEVVGLKIGETPYIPISDKFLLASKFENENILYKDINFDISELNIDLENIEKSLQVVYKIYGTAHKKFAPVEPFSFIN